MGSILGPILFLLFVNDLLDVVQHCTVNLYADDTTIYSTDENPVVLETRMEKDLESGLAMEWNQQSFCKNAAGFALFRHLTTQGFSVVSGRQN